MVGDRLCWEEVPCPLCHASSQDAGEAILCVRPAALADGAPACRLLRCRRCGLGYLSPRPTERTIGALYRLEDYSPYRLRQPDPRRGLFGRLERLASRRKLGHPEEEDEATPCAERLLARLLSPWLGPGGSSQTAIPYLGQGRLLDYGCGAGWFAWRMQQRGWKVTGLEMNAPVAALVRERLGLSVLAGTLPHPQLEPESFDVVNLGAVLEHVHDPHSLVRAAGELLAPGGRLVVSVPNLDSAAFRWFGQSWFPLDIPFHLLHFNPRTLSRLVREHGLEVEQVRQLGRTSWMRQTLRRAAGKRRWVARLANHGPLPAWLTRLTLWLGRADCLLLWARKPAVSTPRAVKTTPALRRAA